MINREISVNVGRPTGRTLPLLRPKSGWAGLLGIALLVFCAGCQTFSLSEEDFQKQQRGECVDQATGDAVTVLGTAGYWGAVIGQAAAAAARK